MKKNRKRAGAYLSVTLVLTLIATVLRSVALIKHYNPQTGYFSEKALIAIANWIVAAAAVFAVTYIFSKDRKRKFVATYRDATTYIPAALVAVAVLFLGVDLISELLKPFAHSSIIITATNLIAIALAVFCAVSFIVCCLLTERRNVTRATLQICATLFFAVYAAYIYFENPYPLNAPNKIVDISAYLAATVFILYETRISLGRDIWHMYTAFGLLTVITCAYSSIPSLITYFAEGVAVSRSVAESVLTLTLFLFAAFRLIRSLYLFEEAEAKTVSIIKADEAKMQAKAHAAEQARIDEQDPQEEAEEENANYTIELGEAEK